MKPFPLLISVLALSMAVSADAIERPTAPLRETVPGLRIETQAYPDHAATEWQFRLRAPEAGESPLYENLKSADFEVAFPADAAVMLHWSKGSHSEPGDFEPKTNPLVVGEPFVARVLRRTLLGWRDALLQSRGRRRRTHRGDRLDRGLEGVVRTSGQRHACASPPA